MVEEHMYDKEANNNLLPPGRVGMSPLLNLSPISVL
jgi:hypothetical protein